MPLSFPDPVLNEPAPPSPACPIAKLPHRVVVYAVAGLSVISVLAYAALMVFVGPESPPETLANIAMTGIGVLGGMAMPQQG
jgi:hypothetical protein